MLETLCLTIIPYWPFLSLTRTPRRELQLLGDKHYAYSLQVRRDLGSQAFYKLGYYTYILIYYFIYYNQMIFI